MKRVPRFWWDVHWADGAISGIVVESDDPAHPKVMFLPVGPGGDIARQQARANAILADLEAGRLDYRRAAKECCIS